MTVIDHGHWVQYKPDRPQKTMIWEVQYAKRKKDDKDWYDYVHKDKPFKSGSVVMTVRRWEEGGSVFISTATRNPPDLFPVNHQVIEITDYKGKNPIDEFAARIIDIKTGKVSDPPRPEDPMDKLLARIEELEKKLDARS
jgi:hypothetical protein